MKNKTEYKTVVSLNLPIVLMGKVDEIAQRHRTANRSDVIRQLLEIGVFIEGKMGMVETITNEDMEEIRKQLEHGNIVDWVQTLDHKRLSTLVHIFEDERKHRGIKSK